MTAVHTAVSIGYPVFRKACVFLIYENVSALQTICFGVGHVSGQNYCKMKGFLDCGGL